MPKQQDNKLSEFIRAFQREVDVAPGEASLQEKKLAALREYLPNDQYPLNFSECVGLYKIVLEQDKAFQFRQKKNWHREEVQILTFIVSELYLLNTLDIELVTPEMWNRISSFFNGRTADDCKFKWLSLSKHPINSCAWDAEEEKLLRTILQEVDYETERPRWNKIAKLFNARSHRNSQIYRSSKELKRKWVSKICRLQKGLWKKEEDLLLFENVRQNGKKWSLISKKMKEYRTENGVKNRFLSVMDKEISSCMAKKKTLSSEEQLINKIIKRLQGELENSDKPQLTQERSQADNSHSASEQNQQVLLQPGPKNIQLEKVETEEAREPRLQAVEKQQHTISISPVYLQCLQTIPTNQFSSPVMLNWNMFAQMPMTLIPNQFQLQYSCVAPTMAQFKNDSA